MDNTNAMTPPTTTPDEMSLGERGASLVEYAFLVALIAMACLLAVQVLGSNVDNSLSSSGSQVGNAGS